jgi:CrcB protein
MNQLLWVALGGALGSVARYGVSQWMGVREAPQFPWHTFSINVAGCLLIGLVWALMQKQILDPSLRFFLITGILGGFTTFSAFGLETFQLFQAKQYFTAFSYVTLSNVAGIAVLFIGYKLAGS